MTARAAANGVTAGLTETDAIRGAGAGSVKAASCRFTCSSTLSARTLVSFVWIRIAWSRLSSALW